jgi:DeoR family suf operon transcriptional repressor
MTRKPPSSRRTRQPLDRPLLEVLRSDGPLEIDDLTNALDVTATAVRQRLQRAIESGLVDREQVATSQPRRGRPRFAYRLTAAGRETAGDNFRDLASVLWEEVRSIREPTIRRGLLGRIGKALAARCSDQVSGETPGERLQSVAHLLQQRAISCRVEAEPTSDCLPVLVTHSCPYPELAEQDRGICAAERLMLEDLVGSPVQLADCRLDGGECCRFVTGSDNQRTATPPEKPRPAMVQQVH